MRQHIVGVFLKFFFFFGKKKSIINNFTSFRMLLLLAEDRPKLAGAVCKTTCNMETFNLLVIFKQLLLLILLSLAHADKGQYKMFLYHLQRILLDQACSFHSCDVFGN